MFWTLEIRGIGQECSTPMSMISNVLYKFSCLCNRNVTYIGRTTT